MALVSASMASSIINKLFTKAQSLLDEGLLPKGISAEIQRVNKAVPQIESVLSFREREKTIYRNDTLDAWCWQLKDAVDAAEDVLDEFDYYDLEAKIEAGAGGYEALGSISHRKRKFVRSVDHAYRGDTLKRLREAVKGLDRAAAGSAAFVQILADCSLKPHNYPIEKSSGSSFSLREEYLFGREREKEKIVNWLMNPVDDDVRDCNISALAIVGMGGVGKTTLAQFVYNDPRVSEYFDRRMWVCVSNCFDTVSMTKKILQASAADRFDIQSLRTLQSILRKQVTSKRILLVLDDVWDEASQTEWASRFDPLNFGERGSKIVLTTRMRSVADTIGVAFGGKIECMVLGWLEERDCLMLFNKYAFAGEEPDHIETLIEIGKAIIKKASGLPLAVKVLAGLLKSSFEVDFWNQILEEDTLSLEQGNTGIMPALRLSYDHLPSNLQLCFRFCSIFPSDYVFQKDELVRIWIASGLIQPDEHGKQTVEDIGAEHFDALTKKSFFDYNLIDAGVYYKPCYIMHDLIHDLARAVSSQECLRIEAGKSVEIPKTVRHVYVEVEDALVLRKISCLKNLRTLVVSFKLFDPEPDLLDEVIPKMRNLRLLSLSASSLSKVPNSIDNLIHLRHLRVKQELSSREKLLGWFPRSVYKLYHLQVLEFLEAFEGRHESIEFDGLSNLINLRYLHVSNNIMSKAPQIGTLTSLQELNFFNVRDERGYRIGELKKLKNLRQLLVSNLQNVKNTQEAKEAELNQKKNLNSLSLQWSVGTPGVGEMDEQILGHLQPHANLKELKIQGYGGYRPPVWLSYNHLPNLESIDLCNCDKLKQLPPLGGVPTLKYLKLSGMQAITHVDSSFYGAGDSCLDDVFPALRELRFESMMDWEEWVGVENVNLFPQLNTLEIIDCPKLSVLPPLSPSLRQLVIGNAGVAALPGMHGTSASSAKPSLVSLDIHDCPKLRSLDGFLLQLEERCNIMEELSIINCKTLECLPVEWLGNLASLKRLTIAECPRLTAHETYHNQLPLNLQQLTIGSNAIFNPSVFPSFQLLCSLTRLRIDGCAKLEFLPSAEIFSNLKALYHLEIVNCRDLSSLDGIQGLTALRYLMVCGCDSLIREALPQLPWVTDNFDLQSADRSIIIYQANAPVPIHQGNKELVYTLKLSALHIGDHLLLHVEPIRSLTSVKYLTILGDLHLSSLPEEWLLQNQSCLQKISVYGAISLQHLPSGMESLSLLQSLLLHNAPMLQSLPDMPASLKNLSISSCHPVMKERCKRYMGQDWPKIAHIPSVTITEESVHPHA